MDDELVFDAVAMRLSAAIEELSVIDESVLLEWFGEAWFEIKATRNAIAHNYAEVNAPMLTETIANELPLFEARLIAIRESA